MRLRCSREVGVRDQPLAPSLNLWLRGGEITGGSFPPRRGEFTGLQEAQVVLQNLRVIERDRRRRLVGRKEPNLFCVVLRLWCASTATDIHHRDGLSAR